MSVQDRLEELRTVIRGEHMSYSELAELQGLAEHIEPGDVELLEWAGVPEDEAFDVCGLCGVRRPAPGMTACSTCA